MNETDPGNGFVRAEPSLEDVFFGAIHRSNRETAAA
jgi:hypothetical protein